MKNILDKIVNNNENLSREEVCHLMLDITREQYTDIQISALLTALQTKGVTADELLGFRDAILQTGVHVDLSPYSPIDIVGTGGDGKNTFNISTCACFVVAGAGYKVAKHGNYAATSVSGASSVLENHGVNFTSDNDRLLNNLEKCNFTYLHAPLFARAMKYVAAARKGIGIPTCFNLLGPLVNPCHPSYQVLGTARLDQMRLYANVMERLNMHYCIVNSLDGYDEISLTSDFKVITPEEERIVSPSSLPFAPVNAADIFGGNSPAEAMHIFDSVLENTAPAPCIAVVTVNAAYAIHTLCPAKSIEECLDEAHISIESGKALAALTTYVQLNA
ncbi:MAG: anthranilate phosphoribosyltransferase [Prevotellaceae bacterium]|nr:anthranilate phosphoribosyltransferase [Prevotellaceae bacterium]